MNPQDKFALVFNNLLEILFIERMELNEEVFARYTNDEAFQKMVTGWMTTEVHNRLSGKIPTTVKYPSPTKK